jgi:hypothetical protein
MAGGGPTAGSHHQHQLASSAGGSAPDMSTHHFQAAGKALKDPMAGGGRAGQAMLDKASKAGLVTGQATSSFQSAGKAAKGGGRAEHGADLSCGCGHASCACKAGDCSCGCGKAKPAAAAGCGCGGANCACKAGNSGSCGCGAAAQTSADSSTGAVSVPVGDSTSLAENMSRPGLDEGIRRAFEPHRGLLSRL